MDQLFGSILSFLKESQEWNGLGWNIFTLSLFIAFGEGFAAPWALWHQTKTVWMSADVSGMSVVTRLALCAYYVSTFNYGLSINSAVLYVLAPILFSFHLAIAVGLWRANRGFTAVQWLFVLLFVAIAGASFVPSFRVLIFGGLAFGFIPFTIGQPIKMWREQSAAGVNLREPLVSAGVTLAWATYGLFVSPLIAATSSIYFLNNVAILVLYRHFRATAPRST